MTPAPRPARPRRDASRWLRIAVLAGAVLALAPPVLRAQAADASAPAEAPPATEATPESEAAAPVATVTATGEQPGPEAGAAEEAAAPAAPDPWKALMAARRAAWAGRLDEAVDRYEDLLEHEPAHVRALGELGNVFFRMRRWRDAGEAYGEASLRVIDYGDPWTAVRFLPLVRRLAPRMADEVEARLEEIGFPHRPGRPVP